MSALDIVNDLRAARDADPLSSLDERSMLDERGRELYWEGTRRADQIRFGTFLDTWDFKDTQEEFRVLYPVPQQAWARTWHGWSLGRALALYHAWRGEHAEAEAELREAYAAQRRAPLPLADADYLVSFAALALFAGETERAAVLAGAARSAMARYRSWRGHDAGAIYVILRQRIQAALDSESAARARERGRAMDEAEAFALAQGLPAPR